MGYRSSFDRLLSLSLSLYLSLSLLLSLSHISFSLSLSLSLSFSLRHRMRFASKLGKLGSTPAPGDPPAARPQPTLDEEKPLMSPVSPTPSQVTTQHHFPLVQEENSHSVHFFNMGYFLLSKE